MNRQNVVNDFLRFTEPQPFESMPEIDPKDAELTKLKSDVERLSSPQEFILQRITAPMQFASAVEIIEDKCGRIFKFVDHTGHAHGYFQEGNPLSSTPENVAGVSKYDGWWFWIIKTVAPKL